VTRKEIESMPFFSECHLEVGDGWLPILRRLGTDMAYSAPSVRAIRVKEKLGGLRVYFDAQSETDRKITREAVGIAERESYKTCEVCGKPGEIKSENGWLKARCEGCK